MRNFYKNKGNRRKQYIPIVPTNSKNKKNKNVNTFVAPNSVDPNLAKNGISMEKTAFGIKSVLLLVLLIGGIIITILDIKDDGLIRFEGLGFKYSGSCIGIIVIIVATVAIIKIKPDVQITK